MHIYISGIGGTAMASLALIAHEAGYRVSGSDARASTYLEYLAKHGISNTHIGVGDEFIAKVHAKDPIDWFVYGSAQPMDFPDHPEFKFCEQHGIKQSKRDEFINQIINDKHLQLIAVAGTHGKTTTTAMIVWLFDQLGFPVSYSGGAKLSFGDVAKFDPKSKFFVYEADEYDRNFLSFYPELAVISGVDYDHPDIYPSREAYMEAFREFLDQSKSAVLWLADAERLALEPASKFKIFDADDTAIDKNVKLAGRVNREDAWLAAQSLTQLGLGSLEKNIKILNKFPGLSRRFEMLAPNIYTDYAHTPAKIRGALQLAHETAGDNVVVVYEGLHNTRQHFIKDELEHLFDGVKKLYVVPSFLAREDPDLPKLEPSDLVNLLSNQAKANAESAKLDDELLEKIKNHAKSGDLVLALSAGGAGSLDERLRSNL